MILYGYEHIYTLFYVQVCKYVHTYVCIVLYFTCTKTPCAAKHAYVHKIMYVQAYVTMYVQVLE